MHRTEINILTGERREIPYTPEEEAAHAAAVAAGEADRIRMVKLADIASIEAQITPRRMRDAVLTTDGRTWLEAKEAEISGLRALL